MPAIRERVTRVLRTEADYEAAVAEVNRLLEGMLGGRSRVSEFFSGKRWLSIEQVKTLREKLDIPADLLIE